MSALEVALVSVAAAWLSILSVVIVLLIRQLDLLREWASEQGGPDGDGLEVGAEVPDELRPLISDRSDNVVYLLFLGGNCQPCREFALEAGRSDRVSALEGSCSIFAAVTGSDAQSDEVAALLPGWFRSLRRETATALLKGFEVQQTPSMFEIEHGKVTGRAVAGYGLVNFLNLVEARAKTDASKFAGTPDADVLKVATGNRSEKGRM